MRELPRHATPERALLAGHGRGNAPAVVLDGAAQQPSSRAARGRLSSMRSRSVGRALPRSLIGRSRSSSSSRIPWALAIAPRGQRVDRRDQVVDDPLRRHAELAALMAIELCSERRQEQIGMPLVIDSRLDVSQQDGDVQPPRTVGADPVAPAGAGRLRREQQVEVFSVS
ncbi:MAG TPA: hypothetical protein VGR11_13760 [Solirubrobacteraceae bacterium]|nr:hypothetical protein [Solirubrobacteraceae bacterium]